MDYIQKYIEHMRSEKLNNVRNYSDATINTSLDYLKAALMYAIENNNVQRNHVIEKVIRFRKHMKDDCKLEPN